MVSTLSYPFCKERDKAVVTKCGVFDQLRAVECMLWGQNSTYLSSRSYRSMIDPFPPKVQQCGEIVWGHFVDRGQAARSEK